MSEYDKQAEQFLKETNTEFKAEFLKNDFYFEDDKEKRDIYKITLKKYDKEYKFNFGQSINKSGKTKKVNSDGKDFKGNPIRIYNRKNENYSKPTPYDVLSCLQKYEVGTFKDFCRDFGYDEDSRKAEKIYKAVVEEFRHIQILFNDEEIKKLREIQ